MTPNTHLQLEGKQQPQQLQRLMASMQMQQAIHMLQMPLQELESFLEEQIAQNPLLELDKEEDKEDSNEAGDTSKEEAEIVINDNDFSVLDRLSEDFQDHFSQTESFSQKRTEEEDELKTYQEQSLPTQPTLYQELITQALEAFSSQKDLEIAEKIIGYVDASGLMTTSLSEIAALHAFPEEEGVKILKIIQTFEPEGIAAASVQESLLIQLAHQGKKDSLAYTIVENCYDLLIHNQIPQIQKQLKTTLEKIQKAITEDITHLNLHPGIQFLATTRQIIVPDVTLKLDGESLSVLSERDFLSSLRLNKKYLKMLEDESVGEETKHFIKEHLISAKWLMKNLEQRFSTLERIADALAKRQSRFFLDPQGTLEPLTMQSIADELQLHESTVTRCVMGKFIDTPRGLFPLRAFFTSKFISNKGDTLSAATIRDRLLEMIESEDKQHPLSDEQIAEKLKNKGVVCARRTIAKYRTQLHIGNQQERRKFTSDALE